MALITCRECGQKMSDRAECCPHCGCPLHIPEETPQIPENQQPEETYIAPAKKQGGLKWLWAVIPSFLVIAGAVYYFMFVYTPPVPSHLSSDYAYYNLKGKVKDVRWYVETDTGINEITHIQFDSTGRVTPDDSTFIRDDKGEIIKRKIEDNKYGTYYSAIKWENGCLAGFITPWTSSTAEYNIDGCLKTETIHYLKDFPPYLAGDIVIITYSDYKLDEHGNWISRILQFEYPPKEGKEQKSDPFHVSRRITYYP